LPLSHPIKNRPLSTALYPDIHGTIHDDGLFNKPCEKPVEKAVEKSTAAAKAGSLNDLLKN